MTFDDAGGDARLVAGDGSLPACTSLFFPGCSFVNYAVPLVSAVYDTLVERGAVDGISLLCCGKILSYEVDGDELMRSFRCSCAIIWQARGSSASSPRARIA